MTVSISVNKLHYATQTFLQEFSIEDQAPVLQLLLALGTQAAQEQLGPLSTAEERLKELKQLVAAIPKDSLQDVMDLKHQVKLLQSRLNDIEKEPKAPQTPKQQIQKKAPLYRSATQPHSVHYHPKSHAPYPSWWPISTADDGNKKSHYRIMQEPRTPRKQVDEACQTNPRELERMKIQEDRDAKLRLAARGLYDVRELDGYSDIDEHLQGGGWFPLHSKYNEITHSAPQLSKKKYRQQVKSKMAKEELENSSQSTYDEDSRSNIAEQLLDLKSNDFIQITRDFVRDESDFFKVLQE